MLKRLPGLTASLLTPFLLISCGDSSNMAGDTQAPAAAPAAESGPAISNVSIEQNPNPTVPLAAILSLTTDSPTRITLNFDDGERSWSATPSDEYATDHSVPVLGMKPGRTHTITATAEDRGGSSTTSDAVSYTTPELPDTFPRPTAVVRDADRMEPGVTLFNVNGRWNSEGRSAPPNFSPAMIVDDQGETLWYYLPEGHRVHDIKRLSNGNMIYEIWPGTGGMVEIDMLGNIVNWWHFARTAKNPAPGSIPIDHDSIHHDVRELPNGNLLVLSTEHRVVEDWFTSVTDPDAPRQTANLASDVIIEVTWDGTVLREWKLHDLIDPYRISYRSLREDYYAAHYEGIVDGVIYDWTHANAIIYEEEDHSVVLSVPYQNAIMKVSLDTGELVWILGDPTGWREPWSEKVLQPVGDVEWSYLHHEVSHSGRGTYLLFDNGVGRAMPFDGREPMALEDSYSRGVEYRVDEENMTVEQVWEYGPDDEWFYGRYLGDIDWLPQTGNILINVGSMETGPDGNAVPPGQAQRWARFFEVTSDTPAEKVWELQLRDEGLGWSVYRVERLPSVYP